MVLHSLQAHFYAFRSREALNLSAPVAWRRVRRDEHFQSVPTAASLRAYASPTDSGTTIRGPTGACRRNHWKCMGGDGAPIGEFQVLATLQGGRIVFGSIDAG